MNLRRFALHGLSDPIYRARNPKKSVAGSLTSGAMNAWRLDQSLLRFYDQRGVPGAPWPVLNELSDEALDRHLALNRALEDASEPHTSQHAHARLFGAWISQMMMIRRFRREFPHLAG